MHATTRQHGMPRRLMGALVSFATLLTGGIIAMTAPATDASAEDFGITYSKSTSYDRTLGNATFEAAREKYGLAKNMREGATLHVFEWSFKTMTENMEDIALAGYTSIQTSPIVTLKDNRKLGTGNWYLNWYYIYQPIDMNIGNYVLGSEDDFKEMCNEAHKYGIRVIVDSVSNHFTSDFDIIVDRWRNLKYFHENKNISDYNSREDCTQHELSGLRDLNTQDAEVTAGMKELLERTVADGADGFRYDAAKHIELPDEVFGSTSNYWREILDNGSQYQYGEVLEDANVREADYADMFWASSVGGGGITDSSYGHDVRNAVQANRNLDASHFTNHAKITEEKSVNWVESHDNFSNGEASVPEQLDDEFIMYGWAGITAQKNGMTLFFDRPYHDGGSIANGYYGTGNGGAKAGTYGNASGPFTENSKLGDAGSDLWKDPRVVAVNHFRNAMVGADSAISNCGSDMCLLVARNGGSSANSGVVVANAGASTSLAGQAAAVPDGSYTDEVSGSTLTVSGGTITAGTVDAKTVAVFYNQTRNCIISSASAAPNKGTIPGTKKTITLRAFQATGTTYETSDGQSGSYSDGDTIDIGEGHKYGDKITVTVKGTGEDGRTLEHTYTYTKGSPAEEAEYDPSDGTHSPCDKYCVQYMEKNGYDADHYIDASEPYYEQEVDVNSISINESDWTVDVSEGTQSTTYTATTDPSGVTVKWSSSDTSVASVTNKGVVTAKSAGTATITAKAGDKTATVKVTVTGVAPRPANVIYANVSWTTAYIYMYKGDGASATSNAAWPGAKMTKIDGTDSCGQTGYYYEVPDGFDSDTKIIISDGGSNRSTPDSQPGMTYSGGTVAWTGSGATLTEVSCNSNPAPQPTKTATPTPTPTPTKSAEPTPTPTPTKSEEPTPTPTPTKSEEPTPTPTTVDVTGVTVSPATLTLQEGEEGTLTATVAPANATNKTVTWVSTSGNVAQVPTPAIGDTVTVHALKAGATTIKATAGGKTTTVTVTVTAKKSEPTPTPTAEPTTPVTPGAVTGITITTPSLTLEAGATGKLITTITPSNATNKSVLWLSDTPSVATVAADGTVTAKDAGVAHIVAVASSGKTAFATVTVGTLVYAMHSGNDRILTTDAAERTSLAAAGWVDDGVAFRGSSANAGTPVYRVYNPNSGLHHFTASKVEYDALIGLGWTGEDVKFYVSSRAAGATPVYRGYNGTNGAHQFTAGSLSSGFTNEGVAWYAVAAR